MPLIRPLLGALALAVVSSTAHAAEAGPPAVNEQRPIHLNWQIIGELNLPGLGGARALLGAYLPGIPLYLAGEVAYSWGLSPDHASGEREDYFMRYLTETLTFEARAGVSFERWSVDPELVDFTFDHQTFGNLSTWKVNTYRVQLPTYQRDTFYGGYRHRDVPGAEPCDAQSRPAHCAESATGFLMAGYEYLRGRNATFRTKEHGELRVHNTRFMGFHFLWATGDDSREGFAERFGGEFYWGYSHGWAGRWSLGWDGRYVLLSLGIGGGKMHSFGGAAPSTETLR